MKAALIDHLGGAEYLANGLDALDIELTPDHINADYLFADHDAPWSGREGWLAEGLGKRIIYPHGAGAYSTALYDGCYPVSPHVDTLFVIGEGQKEVAKRINYPNPVEAIGWGFCDLAPVKTCSNPKTVLFAPTHGPWYNSRDYLIGNIGVYKALLRLDFDKIVVKLTPSTTIAAYVEAGQMEPDDVPRWLIDGEGIWESEGVEIVVGEMSDRAGQIALIDSADVVVADPGTFGNLAVARGVPTVMWGSVSIVADPWRRIKPHHPEAWASYVRYPFDCEYQPLDKCIEQACTDIVRTGEWRERFIGEAFTAEKLANALGGL